jgi:hypothetical protein
LYLPQVTSRLQVGGRIHTVSGLSQAVLYNIAEYRVVFDEQNAHGL